MGSICAGAGGPPVKPHQRNRKEFAIICFLRHGKADPPKSVPDEDRQLLNEGRRELRAAATVWRKLGIRPMAVFTSPRQRSIDSAQLFIEAIGVKLRPSVSNVLAPGAQWRDFKQLLRDCAADKTVVFVGHEPDLSGAIMHLTGAANIRLKEGGLCCVEVSRAARKGSGVLTLLLDPVLYREGDRR
jgi:phosphohistidine phosphatase SixA